jgi:phage gp36-like protein
MSYCTKQNLIDRFGETELIQRTDRAGTGVINDAVLNEAIADADAEIDGYLTTYALPLQTVPAVMERIACDIARYYLFGDGMIEQIKTRYDNAIKYLNLVAKGTISLAPDTSGAVPVAASAEVEFQSSSAVFSRNAY